MLFSGVRLASGTLGSKKEDEARCRHTPLSTVTCPVDSRAVEETMGSMIAQCVSPTLKEFSIYRTGRSQELDMHN